MSNRYEFMEIQEFVQNETDYESVDYYRMVHGDSIALDLRDKPEVILRTHLSHGGDRQLFNWASEQGIIRTGSTEADPVVLHDLTTGEPLTPYAASHVAMMMCFPERYQPFFEGELCWTEQDSKMVELCHLTGSTHTCQLHKSTWWGDHEIIEEEPKKVGRPPKEKTEKTKTLSQGHKAWVQACQDYKERLVAAWGSYMDACAERKRQQLLGDEWLRSQKQAIQEEAKKRIEQVEAQYRTQMEKFNQEVHNKYAVHSELKSQGKPKREDFVELR